MFRLIQIDPETLAIQVNASAIDRHPQGAKLLEFLDQTYLRGPAQALKDIFESDERDLSILEFSTSYLHELRHFCDLLVTPFGFYRIRTAFEFYVNMPRIIWSEEPIPIPLMSGMDPTTRGAISLKGNFENSFWHQLGRTALSRVKLINAENTYDQILGDIKVGGDRILEGLAYITQFEFIFQNYDTA